MVHRYEMNGGVYIKGDEVKSGKLIDDQKYDVSVFKYSVSEGGKIYISLDWHSGN